jgi:membrane protein CcdC involved in cytochrome C biogenesis
MSNCPIHNKKISKFQSTILLLLVILLVGVYFNQAHAQTSASNISSLDVSKLTPEQKAKMIASVVEMQKESTGHTSATVRKEAEQWIDLGGNMGRAAVAAAKELGIAANDFVKTPLGMVTMAVVVYKFVGASLLHIVFGLFFFILTIGLTVHFVRADYYASADYERVPVLWGLFHRKVVKNYQTSNSIRDTNIACAFWVLSVGTVITLAITFSG